MKIYIPTSDPDRKIGGGFVFIENFRKGAAELAEFVDNWPACDVMLIAGATLAETLHVQKAKAAGKKIVLRIDNLPRNSRNHGTSVPRLKEFAKLADVIIFQSQWASNFVGGWLYYDHDIPLDKIRTETIYNGCDTSIFNHDDDPSKRGASFLYSCGSTDENKRFPEAAYDFYVRTFEARRQQKKPPFLRLVGRFSKALIDNNFDFFNGEKFFYSPPITNREKLASIYRSCRYLYFPAFADAAPNTVVEAMACGLKPLLVHPVGGTEEIVRRCQQHIPTIQEMAFNYCEVMK